MPGKYFCKKIKSAILYGFAVVGLVSIFTAAAEAQIFGSGGNNQQNNPLVAPARPATQPKPAIRGQQPSAAASLPSVNNILSPVVDDDDDDETDDRQPADWNQDKSVVQIRFVGNDVVIDDKPKILIYMRNFKISRTITGKTNCSMRFYVRSTASEKLTNLSFRLKWPKMETALAFDDVMPNVATYFDYSLIGDGCYSMDSAPNIIVNRCRIKGMSQRQCADAIQWMK